MTPVVTQPFKSKRRPPFPPFPIAQSPSQDRPRPSPPWKLLLTQVSLLHNSSPWGWSTQRSSDPPLEGKADLGKGVGGAQRLLGTGSPTTTLSTVQVTHTPPSYTHKTISFGCLQNPNGFEFWDGPSGSKCVPFGVGHDGLDPMWIRGREGG